MNRYIVFFTVIILATLILTGCSRGTGNGVLPDADSPGVVDQRDTGSNSMLLGYYDIYFDPGSCTFDVVGNRTVDFTVNIVPLMNNMPSPPNGIWLSNIVLHDDIPGVLGVDIDFGIYHPYPAMDMFKVYDLMGVVIGDGSQILEYSYPLRVAERFTDLWMTNPDGYTRWFNPSDFAKAGFFGYMPGGIQNYAGNAQVNPYKYYAQDLGPEEDVWEFLTGGDNYDSLFQSGDDRTMKLEFVKPPDGIGVKFGYAVVACWEDQGEGPYTPYHRREAIAVSVAVTPDIWFDGTNSGGDLILDFDLFSWENQPDIIKIESSVLADTAEFDASAIGTPLSDQVSSYHVEIGSKELTSAEGHEFWIIAESLEYDYSNGNDNLIFPDGPLAAFFRYPLEVSGEPINELPVITEIYDDIMGQGNGYEPNITGDTSMPVTYTVDYYDPDSDPCYVTWYCTVKDIPINESTDQVGDSGNCPVDWHSPDFGQGEWDLYARVDDGIGYTQSKITVTVSELTSHFNIPLREGYSAVDLAVDHTNGDLLVLYLEDGAVYKYTEAGDYQDGAEFVLTFEPGMDFIDIAPNGNFIVGGQFQSAADKVKIYGPDGTLIKVSGSEMYESHCNDVIAFTGNTYTNMLGNSSFTPQGTYMKWRFYEPPGYSVYIYADLY
ncbi:MAG: hypothetical protein NTY09_11975, partial [bacterium]|nr:hypothetical protein [bacterium]